jgi:hypothetical protein
VAAGHAESYPEAVEQATRKLERAEDLEAPQRMTRDHQVQHGAVEPVAAAEE